MSKIGVHSVGGPGKGYGDPGFLGRLKGATTVTPSNPLPVMAVGDFGRVKEAQDVLGASRVLGIGRVDEIRDQYGNRVNLQAFEPKDFDNAAEAAKAYYSLVKPKWLQNPHIKIWGTFNEFSAHEAWQGAFYQTMMDLVEPDGFKLILYNFSSGNPPGPASGGIDPAIIQAIVPALREAKRRGHYLGVHEYGGIDNADGTMRNAAPFHTLRHRWLHEQLRVFDADPQMIITECAPHGGANFAALGVQGFLDDVRWYDAELFKDSYIMAATLFTIGTWGDGQGNYQEALPALAEYIATTPTPPPVFEPPLEPCRGLPRTQYERVYVVIHPAHANFAPLNQWYAAVGTHQLTVGPSADDGGIGDLNDKTVVVVNPDLWGGDQVMREWYATHYPGVRYLSVAIAMPGDLATWLSAGVA